MFYNANSFTGGDLTDFDVSSGVTFSSMFRTPSFAGDVSGWTTAKAEKLTTCSTVRNCSIPIFPNGTFRV
jgi:hypothetical protein